MAGRMYLKVTVIPKRGWGLDGETEDRPVKAYANPTSFPFILQCTNGVPFHRSI
jgi:hypothetical protein